MSFNLTDGDFQGPTVHLPKAIHISSGSTIDPGPAGHPGTPLKAVGLTGQIVRGLLEGEEVLWHRCPKVGKTLENLGENHGGKP